MARGGGGIPHGGGRRARFGQRGGERGVLLGAGRSGRRIFLPALRLVRVVDLGAPRLIAILGRAVRIVIERIPIVVLRLGRFVAVCVIAREAELRAQNRLGLGEFFGDMVGAAGERRGPALPFGQIGGIGLAREQRLEEFIEAPGGGAGAPGLLGMLVEPGEMREQQPRIIAHPAADRLATVEDRLARAVHRAVGEHLLGGIARQDQRRLPPLRQRGIAPLVDIGRLRRQPNRGAGQADIAVRGEVMKEPHLPRGREGGGADLLPLPLAGGVGVGLLPLPHAGGGWGVGIFPLPHILRVGAHIGVLLIDIFHLKGPTPNPSRRREGGRQAARAPARRRAGRIRPRNHRHGIIGQPDIPLQGHPPPPEPTAALACHPCDSRWNKCGTMAWMGGVGKGVGGES